MHLHSLELSVELDHLLLVCLGREVQAAVFNIGGSGGSTLVEIFIFQVVIIVHDRALTDKKLSTEGNLEL